MQPSIPRYGFLENLPIIAAAYYAAAQARLAEYPVWGQIRKFLSAGFTAALLLVSTGGFYQLWSMYTVQQHAPAVVQTRVSRKVAQPAAAVSPRGLARSAPTTLSIPAISLSSELVGVGQNDDGSLQVPASDSVGWYTLAPTPGEIGPAILVGHVDDYLTGPAVFAGLKDLQIGDSLTVAREDGSLVTFSVTKTAAYEADNFPTQEVYGNIDHAGLRLITCYGTFNQLTRHYSHNLVVYAKAIN